MHVTTNEAPPICRYYLQGHCRFGNRCRFTHVDVDDDDENNLSFSTEENETYFHENFTRQDKSYSEALHPNILKQNLNIKKLNSDSEIELCPYFEKNFECPFNEDCSYIHGDICSICNLPCLHPFNEEQRDKHIKMCSKELEDDMEEAFSFQCSHDKSCGICMEVVWEKDNASNQRFGILENCDHVFCLPCIRKWRSSKAYENKIVK